MHTQCRHCCCGLYQSPPPGAVLISQCKNSHPFLQYSALCSQAHRSWIRLVAQHGLQGQNTCSRHGIPAPVPSVQAAMSSAIESFSYLYISTHVNQPNTFFALCKSLPMTCICNGALSALSMYIGLPFSTAIAFIPFSSSTAHTLSASAFS